MWNLGRRAVAVQELNLHFYSEMCVWVDKLGNCVHVCQCLHTQGGGVLVVAKHGFGMIIYYQHYNLLISSYLYFLKKSVLCAAQAMVYTSYICLEAQYLSLIKLIYCLRFIA